MLCTPVTLSDQSNNETFNKDECQIILMRFTSNIFCNYVTFSCNGIIQAERTSFDPFLNLSLWTGYLKDLKIFLLRSSVSSEVVPKYHGSIRIIISFTNAFLKASFSWVGGILDEDATHYSSIFIKIIKIRCLILSS